MSKERTKNEFLVIRVIISTNKKLIGMSAIIMAEIHKTTNTIGTIFERSIFLIFDI